MKRENETKGLPTVDKSPNDAFTTLADREEEEEGFQYQRLETVLLVEDDRHLSQALRLRLQRAGLNVACSFDGSDGLEKQKHLEPDVIVLDLCLPRVDGARFLHFLRTTPGLMSTRIVAITGKADPALEGKVRHWGVDRFLRKPVSPRRLVETVLEVLEGV